MLPLEVDERIHVRYSGNTYNYLTEDLDLPDNPTDKQIIDMAQAALADEIQDENVTLQGFVVERYEENYLFDVHPQAKFG